MELKVNEERWHDRREWETGIYVRAKTENEGWQSADIGVLDKESLLVFLKSRGGDNKWAEDCVGILLGHGHLHKPEPTKEG